MRVSSAESLVLAGLAGARVAHADYANSTVTTAPAPTATGTACAEVSASWAAQAGTATPTVAASLAYECINSVPLNKQAALKFIDEIIPYIEWQSSTAYLKDPPADYFYPAYDVHGEIARVRAGLEAGKYANEYSWQADFYKSVFGPAHDGHFVVYPDVLSNAMEWGRAHALVSISEDGTSAPVIKLYEDVMSSPETASVLTLINGVDAATYIADWIYQASANQDADSAYNSMFYQKSFAVNGGTGFFKQGGRIRYIYPGEKTTFTFANGTEFEADNVARLKGSWTGVTDGESFFKTFAPGAVASQPKAPEPTTTSTAPAEPTATSTGLPGYPKPIIVASDNSVSGYFIEEPGFEDVAVLAMISFGPADPAEFQSVVQEFFAACVEAGKTKLIADVQVNPGGYIFQGYDTFRQIFPDVVQNGTGRWRYSSGFKAVSEVLSADCEGYDPLTASADLIQECEAVYNWRYDLDVNNKHFTSYEDKFLTSYPKDNYTDLQQWDFNNPLDTINSTYGIGYDVTGYRSRQNFTRPFGGPENVVILLDGVCASTCTLFHEFMKWDVGVQSIAVGGRPEIEGKIQGVGGVKGSQSYDYSNVLQYAQVALNNTEDEALRAELSRYTDYVISRSSAAALNVKDEILRPNREDGTPAQFIAEYSDCRIFWEADMHRDVTNLWTAAARAAFQGGKCAYGAITSSEAVAKESKRAARPAPFDRPRYQLPKKPVVVPQRVPVAKLVARKNVLEGKDWSFFATQFMQSLE